MSRSEIEGDLGRVLENVIILQRLDPTSSEDNKRPHLFFNAATLS